MIPKYAGLTVEEIANAEEYRLKQRAAQHKADREVIKTTIRVHDRVGFWFGRGRPHQPKNWMEGTVIDIARTRVAIDVDHVDGTAVGIERKIINARRLDLLTRAGGPPELAPLGQKEECATAKHLRTCPECRRLLGLDE